MTAPHLAAGQVVAGRYTIRATLGFTGEAATYHAVASTGHEVVLKLLDPAVAQRADVMSKLERVHAILAQLPMELCVPVADSGYDMSTGAPFLVSECVQTPSLQQLCEHGPLPANVVAQLVGGIAAALDRAHAQQLYHLALKPANAFVGPAPAYPVRLADFGASVVRSTSPTHEAYAQSAPWWAPEQLQPAAVLGGPADVFATALIAFYALTGRSYWRSCQAGPVDLAAWQREIMGARTPVSHRAAELGVQLNAAIDDVFARALSVNQPDRPRSAMDLAQALGSLGASAPHGSYGERGAAKTMSFPDGGYGPADGGYPAGAGYSGGYPASPAGAAYPGADQATPDPRGQMPSGQGYAGATPASGYAAPAQAAAAMAQPGVVQPSPGLPPVPPAPPKSGSAKPIIIGVAAAVVIGGAAATFLFLRPRWTAQANSSASATPVAVSPPPDEAPAASSAPPTQTAAASAAASASSDAAPAEAKVELTLICAPQCDELLVDNEKIDKLEEKNKISVLPGKHTVEARKAGYQTVKDTIDLDKPLEKKLQLFPIAAAPPPPRHCGQFLKCK